MNQLLRLKVLAIRPETRDTLTIFLERTDGLQLSYRAGQFLTLLLSINGKEIRRSYSLSTAPGIDDIAAITVKRVVNGEASRYLQDHLKVGDILEALPPAGRFTLDELPPSGQEELSTLFFIAGGSGIVPVFSLMKTALMQQPNVRVILLSQFRDRADILFAGQLEEMADRYRGQFHWISILSGEAINPDSERAHHNREDGLRSKDSQARIQRQGRLNNWMLEEILGEIQLSVPAEQQAAIYYFLCGPQAFMRMAQFTLRLMGVDNNQIRKENFTVEYVPPPPLISDTTPKKITIHSGEHTWTFNTAWPGTILQSGLDNHIPLPYSCRGGRCSTCTARCIKGQVKMSINEVLTEKDLQEGLILTCVGYALTDVELKF